MAPVREVVLPDIGDFKDVEVIEVLAKPGDDVEAETALITLESDKATMEVPSPYAGTVQSIQIEVGDRISEGAMLLTLAEDIRSRGVCGAGTGYCNQCDHRHPPHPPSRRRQRRHSPDRPPRYRPPRSCAGAGHTRARRCGAGVDLGLMTGLRAEGPYPQRRRHCVYAQGPLGSRLQRSGGNGIRCPRCRDARDIALTIHPHPTLSETVGQAAEVFEGTVTDLYLPRR